MRATPPASNSTFPMTAAPLCRLPVPGCSSELDRHAATNGSALLVFLGQGADRGGGGGGGGGGRSAQCCTTQHAARSTQADTSGSGKGFRPCCTQVQTQQHRGAGWVGVVTEIKTGCGLYGQCLSSGQWACYGLTVLIPDSCFLIPFPLPSYIYYLCSLLPVTPYYCIASPACQLPAAASQCVGVGVGRERERGAGRGATCLRLGPRQSNTQPLGCTSALTTTQVCSRWTS
jgi:hypothetical protein